MNLSDLHGIDISSWQRGLSKSSLNSVDFAILKLSEGTSWNDPCFDEFYSAATIPLGAYVYSHATTEGEAQAEAIHALSLLQGRKLPLGIYMDVEEQKQLALSDSHLTAVVKAFCDAIKRGGYHAGAYGSAGNLWAKVGPSYLGDDVLVWVAQWGSRPRMGDVWQFSASDHVDGFNGNVDGNKVLSERFGQMVVSQEPVNNGSSTQPIEPPKENACEVTLTLPIVKYGEMGLHVKLMQTALIAKGYSCGWMGTDGVFGQQTKIGLYEFQKKNGLETDCVCGAATWKALLNS